MPDTLLAITSFQIFEIWAAEMFGYSVYRISFPANAIPFRLFSIFSIYTLPVLFYGIVDYNFPLPIKSTLEMFLLFSQGMILHWPTAKLRERCILLSHYI